MEQITVWNVMAIIVQTIVILLGFYFSYKQIRQQALDSKAQTTIEIKKMFREYRDITIALRPGGEWDNQSPVHSSEWGLLDDYLGFFEHLEYLISNKMLDLDFVIKSHKAKLQNAMLNPYVLLKVKIKKKWWADLYSLCRRMEIDLGDIEEKVSERINQTRKNDDLGLDCLEID